MIHNRGGSVFSAMTKILTHTQSSFSQRAGKWLLSGLAALSLSACAGGLLALEKPSYTVVAEADGIEFRRYESYLVAETLVTDVADYNAAANEGFRRLFDYISGDNQPADKIAMTAPVQQYRQDQGWLISFMVPTKYRLADAPQPADPRVRIREVQGQLTAALRFSGRWTGRNIEAHRDQLLEQLAALGVTPTGDVASAAYNPPFMPPFMRRNEMLVPVDKIPAVVAGS
ncbi:MAG: hypothetical protein RLZZ385_110 [Pseudomonadota bacterium]|jgi:hypothetical protein